MAPPNFIKLAKDISWDSFTLPNLGSHFQTDPSTWVMVPLLKEALAGGPPALTMYRDGNLLSGIAKLLEVLGAFGFRPIKLEALYNDNQRVWLVAEKAMLSLNTVERGKSIEASLVTNDEELFNKVSALLSRVIVPEDVSKGVVFALAKEMTGYSITRLGVAGSPLERGNYSAQVLEKYDHVVADFNTDKPCGRLVILSGDPGTGKTFLIRSILGQAKKAAFILIPPQMVLDLSGPEILPALTNAKRESNGPIILIVEDADQVLVQRDKADMGGISSLLNLGDGILGAVLDVRILATTNATQLQIDPATRRPGRLCRQIVVDALDAPTATKAIQRLTGKPYRYNQPRTIAQVYLDARDRGWKPTEVVPARMKDRPEILG